jgi:hypothetical protein
MDREGVFERYMIGLRARDRGVEAACHDHPNGVVQYMDIRRFYPTITSDVARRVWRTSAERAHLPERYRDLGEKLLDDHRRMAQGQDGEILTGPIFSHLIGNLALREIDATLASKTGGKYFRYVDDIIIVGEQHAVAEATHVLRRSLGAIGLAVHDGPSLKNHVVSTATWLAHRNDFRDRDRTSWRALIGNLKRFLLLRPDKLDELHAACHDHDLRVPIRDYSAAIKEAGFLARVVDLARLQWFRQRSRSMRIQDILTQASVLREKYEAEFRALIEQTAGLDLFERKQQMPRLRYRAARLVYLGKADVLASLANLASTVPELHFHAKVMDAVATGNIDGVLGLGTNAAQATAQALRAGSRRAITTQREFAGPAKEALAIFQLNGVPVDKPNAAAMEVTELMRFAISGADRDLMTSTDPFMRELACLHGLKGSPRHVDMLDTVFDRAEDLAWDAIELLQQSLSP